MQIITQKDFSVLNLYPCTLRWRNGNPDWNADKSKWAHPEGTAGPPCDNPLSTNHDCEFTFETWYTKIAY